MTVQLAAESQGRLRSSSWKLLALRYTAAILVTVHGCITSEMRLILFAILIAAGVAALLLRPRSAQASLLSVGDQAPGFSTDAISGDQTIQVRLTDYRG